MGLNGYEKTTPSAPVEREKAVPASPSEGIRDAVVGLRWGWSPQDVKLAGNNIELDECNGAICWYKMPKAAKGLSWAESYMLAFVNDSLLKISVMSRIFQNDGYGIEGKRKFAEIDSILSLKYASTSAYLYEGRKVYKEADEFYQCLGYKGCGSWIKFYNGDGRDMVLELVPIRQPFTKSGWINLVVEANPEWPNYLQNKKKAAATSDSDAL